VSNLFLLKMLLFSTLICTVAHAAFMNWSSVDTVHKNFIIGGLLTSILNHSKLCPQYGSLIDRVVVRTAFCVDALACISKKRPIEGLLLTCSGMSYIISKYTGKKYFHVGAHVLGTWAHIRF
jgi:hypothetical protein